MEIFFSADICIREIIAGQIEQSIILLKKHQQY